MQKLSQRRNIWIFTFAHVVVALLTAKILSAKLAIRTIAKHVIKTLASVARLVEIKTFKEIL